MRPATCKRNVHEDKTLILIFDKNRLKTSTGDVQRLKY